FFFLMMANNKTRNYQIEQNIEKNRIFKGGEGWLFPHRPPRSTKGQTSALSLEEGVAAMSNAVIH
uniref:hypothetical protein n=1 Tax=Acinetobacter baumannii TaxID=470 RepID=UPI001C066D81